MAKLNAQKLARIDARMAEWVAGGAYERLEWLIGDESGTLYQGATGPTSIYRIYSMTKPVVSIAALQMVEEARLQLFHRVSRYLPEFENLLVRTPNGPRPCRTPLTIYHLMTHTSGLSYGFMTDGGGARLNALGVHGDGMVSLRDDVARIAQTPLEFEPGSAWLYSVATDVLGAVLEVVADKPLGEILAERVFEPLGMSETSFAPGADAVDRIAPIRGGVAGLLDAVTVSRTYPYDHDEFARGGHGLFSTLEDYGKFARSLLATARSRAPGLVGPVTLAHATRDHCAHLGPLSIESHPASESPGLGGYGFGLGFAVARGDGALVGSPGAFGWSGAAETWFNVNPAEGVYAILMAQNFDWPGAGYDFQGMAAGALE